MRFVFVLVAVLFSFGQAVAEQGYALLICNQGVGGSSPSAGTR
jgi:hypothetical protein